MPTSAPPTPAAALNQAINSALTGDKAIDLFTLGLAYMALANPSEATPAHPGATPTAPPVHPAYPASSGIKGFFEAFKFSRNGVNGSKTDWSAQLPFSIKLLSKDRTYRSALVPLAALTTPLIIKAVANPVPLTAPVDNLEQAIYDLVIANGAAFTPRIDPLTGRDYLEASGIFNESIETLLAGVPDNNSGGG